MSAGALDQDRLLMWFWWKVVLPFLMLVLIWPIYQFMMNLDTAFGRAFAHGDLLIFAGLLLMEVSIEGRLPEGMSIQRKMCLEALRIIAVLAFFMVGFIKWDVITLESASHISSADDAILKAEKVAKLTAYACLSCTVALFAMAVAGWGLADGLQRKATKALAGRTLAPQTPSTPIETGE